MIQQNSVLRNNLETEEEILNRYIKIYITNKNLLNDILYEIKDNSLRKNFLRKIIHLVSDYCENKYYYMSPELLDIKYEKIKQLENTDYKNIRKDEILFYFKNVKLTQESVNHFVLNHYDIVRNCSIPLDLCSEEIINYLVIDKGQNDLIGKSLMTKDVSKYIIATENFGKLKYCLDEYQTEELWKKVIDKGYDICGMSERFSNLYEYAAMNHIGNIGYIPLKYRTLDLCAKAYGSVCILDNPKSCIEYYTPFTEKQVKEHYKKHYKKCTIM